MKVFVVALALVAVVAAGPVLEDPRVQVKIIRSDFQPSPDGGYVWGFETENGITREETGEVKQILDEQNQVHPAVVAHGVYSYINVDGKPETIRYWADETGYHAEGDSIPKPVQPVQAVPL